jgi:uncharacterized damage-inducible protein DinB
MSNPTADFFPFYRDTILGGFANEVETTKKVFSRIPEDKRDYRPDPNARTAWELAWHLANSDIQFLNGIADLEFNMTGSAEAEKPRTIAELVVWYDKHFKRGVEKVRAMSAEQLGTMINFRGMFNLPAAMYLGFLNNHSIHHRGELATYLRPMGAKCPSIYGGSFDEPFKPAGA